MENFTSNCRNVRIAAESLANALTHGQFLHINTSFINSTNRLRFVQTGLVDETVDLLVIDIDSCGTTDASYLIFLATCLTPWRPIVLTTSRNLDRSTKQRYLSSGAMSVIQVTDDVNTADAPL